MDKRIIWFFASMVSAYSVYAVEIRETEIMPSPLDKPILMAAAIIFIWSYWSYSIAKKRYRRRFP